MLQAGDEAPDFSLESDEGETVTLSALRGRPVVFYFYPKDDTPGCTAQACSLRDGYGGDRRAGRRAVRHLAGRRRLAPQLPGEIRPALPAPGRHGPRGRRALRRVGRSRQREDGHPAQLLRRRRRRAPRAGLVRREARGHDAGGPRGTHGMSSATPLAGVRVLDLSRVLAGPYCSMVMADLGADVVKVERPGAGDPTRAWGPPFREGESAYYLCVNRGKRSITVDLGDPAGLEVVRRLALESDVVLESFLPGGAERLGLGYDALSGERPAPRLHVDRRLRARERRCAPARLRFRDPGGGGRHVDHGRGRRPAAQGRSGDRRHHDGDVRGHRHARGAARRREQRAAATTCRSRSSTRSSPGSPTAARTTWSAAMSPTGSATPTRRSSPTRRSRRATAG